MLIFTAVIGGILFKQGFTRGDGFHVKQFFQFTPLCIAIWLIFSEERIRKDLYPCLFSCLVFSYSLTHSLIIFRLSKRIIKD